MEHYTPDKAVSVPPICEHDNGVDLPPMTTKSASGKLRANAD
jgi:hypothetical protein